MRRLHLLFGLVGIAVFLGTGVYMARGFPGLYGTNEALRFMYRANHIYLLLASLVNLALGIYLRPALPGWRSKLAAAGSFLLLHAPAILVVAFFVEVPKASPDRAMTGIGIFVTLLGLLMHLPNARAQRQHQS